MMKTFISAVRMMSFIVAWGLTNLAYAAGDSTTYMYDDLGRLIQINYTDGTSIIYTYDAADNRLSEVVSGNFPIEFSIAASSEPTTEGSALLFTVTRVGDLSQAHSVEFATVPATGASAPATENVDYTATSGTLNFVAGQATKTISVSTIDDVAVESSETVRAALSNPSPGTSIVVAEANGTIADNDVASTFAIASASGDEGSNLDFTVTRSGGFSQSQSVTYATSDGTATAGVDYTADSATVTFLANETSKSISIAALSDALIEGDETFSLTLSNPTGGATISVASATGTINDVVEAGDILLTVGVPETGSYGNQFNGQTDADGRITASFQYTNGPLFLDVTGYDIDAADEVQVLLNGASLGFLSVGPNDGLNSGDSFTLSPQVGNNIITFVQARDITWKWGVTSILLRAGSSNLSIASASGAEGSDLTFTVTRSGDLSQSQSVGYATSDGTATAGSDYTAVSDTLTFLADQSSKTVTVTTLTDAVAEGDETFMLTLSNPTGGATISTAAATGTITDVAVPASFAIADPTGSATEGGDLVFTVTRSGDLSQAQSISYATSDVTATAGSDYTAVNDNLTFAAGTFSLPITVTTLDDFDVEGAETLRVTLSGAPVGTSITTATADGTIADNDVASSLSIASASGDEGTSLTFTVTRSGDTSIAQSVNYATSDGTALAGSDYTAANSTLTFAATETTATITVPALTDGVLEGAEAFTVTLSNPTNGAVITTATASGTINNVGGGTGPATPIVDGVAAAEALADPGALLNGLSEITVAVRVQASQIGTDKGIFDTEQPDGADDVLTMRYDVAGYLGGGQNVVKLGLKTTLGEVQLESASNVQSTSSQHLTMTWRSGEQLKFYVDGVESTPRYVDNAIGGVITGVQDILIGVGSLNATAGGWAGSVDDFKIYDVTLSAADVAALAAGGGSTPASFAVAGAVSSAAEGSDLTFTVTRSGDLSQSQSVGYATSDGTATAGSDYTAVSDTLTFLADQSSKTVTVTTLTDAVAEGDETFMLTLSNPTGGATISTAAATGTITDVAVPASFAIADPTGSATEGGDLVFTVTRSGDLSQAQSISYATSDVTATAGSDYTAANDNLTFAANVTSLPITVSTLEDFAVEGDETLRVTLSGAPAGTTITVATADGTIADNDVASSLSIADVSGDEGASLTFTVTRGGNPSIAQSVDYATSDGTATAGSDYTQTNGTLNFGPSDTTASFTVSALTDGALEGAEAFTVTLSNPTNGASITTATASGTINNVGGGTGPDPDIIVSNVQSATGTTTLAGYTVSAGDNRILAVVVTSQGSNNLDVNSVSFQGTALNLGRKNLNPVEHLSVARNVASVFYLLDTDIGVGTQTGDIVVDVDHFYPGEPHIIAFYLENAAQTTPEATASAQVFEASTSLQGNIATVTPDAVVLGAFAVDDGAIWSPDPGELQIAYQTSSWSSGAVSYKKVSTAGNVTLGWSGVSENRPTLALLAFSKAGSGVATSDLSISGPLNFVTEGNVAEFTVTRSGDISGAQAVSYVTSDGTATAGTDYNAINGTLIFQPSEASKTIPVSTLIDSDAEGHETLLLVLSNPTNGAQIATGSAVATIRGSGLGTPIVDGVAAAEALADPGALLNGLSEISVAVRVQATQIGTDKGIFDTEQPDGADDVLTMRYDAAGYLGGGQNVIKMGLQTTLGEVQLESASNVQSTSSQHLVLTWRSGDQLKLFVDGVEITPTHVDNAIGGVISGIQDILVGVGSLNATAGGWAGDVSDFKIYDVALSASAIAELAAASGIDIELTRFVTDTGEYGNQFNGQTDADGQITASFDYANGPFYISATGYDIDTADEVEVLVNGQQLGFLSVGPNNGLNSGDFFPIPGAMIQPGTNLITFKQTIDVTKAWGITSVLLQFGQ